MISRERMVQLYRSKKKRENSTDDKPLTNSYYLDQHDSIFVSIPSYRDEECAKTLEDLYKKATFPNRVFVGVCQQNEPEDLDCMASPTAQKFKNNIRVLTLTSGEAQGPMYARYLIEKYLFKDEMFLLQTDSHILFAPGWDVECIRQLALCDSEKPVITTYPHDFDRLTRALPPRNMLPTYLRYRGFHERLGFTQQEKRTFARFPRKPYKSLFWAAGFSFTLGSFAHEVPYDPNCPYVFLGEEMSMSMRAWTWGWDFFCPMTNLVFHLTKRTYRPTFWEQVYRKNCVVDDDTRLVRKEMEAEGVERLQKLMLGYEIDDNFLYGLGAERTVEEWEEFAGVSIQDQKGTRRSFYGLSPGATENEQVDKMGRVIYPR